MLKVFSNKKECISNFNCYDIFIDYINCCENQNLIEDHSFFEKRYWTFAEYSPTQLKNICAWVKPEFLTTPQLKALGQGLGLLEICRGNFFKIQEVIVTADIDVEEFKVKFCLDYCLAQEWRLIETQDYKPSQNAFVRERRYAVHPYTRKSRLAQMSLENTRGKRLRAELDCRIGRLRQQSVLDKPLFPTSIQTNTQKREI